MLFFFNRRYPWLRPLAGLAAVAAGLLVHWDVLVAAGAVLTVAGVVLAAPSLRKHGVTGGKGEDGSLR